MLPAYQSNLNGGMYFCVHVVVRRGLANTLRKSGDCCWARARVECARVRVSDRESIKVGA